MLSIDKNYLILSPATCARTLKMLVPALMLAVSACSAEIDQKAESPAPSEGKDFQDTGGSTASDALREANRKPEEAGRKKIAAAKPKPKIVEPSSIDPPAPPRAQPDAAPPSDDVVAGGGDTRGLGGTRGLSTAAKDTAGAEPKSDSGVEADKPRSLTTDSDAAAAAAADKDKFDVVPVYFGTDRMPKPDDKRLKYSSERARKLELGRVLVTVPRAHKVPQIERPWVVKIPYFDVVIYSEKEDPEKHFTMKEIKAMSQADLLKLVRERLAASARYKDHAFVFVHGYNTSFDNAVYRTAQITYDLKFDGAPFVYSWPSGGGFTSYTYDQNSAAQSEPHMRKFLEMVVNESGAKTVSVIAHSMGNQPLLRVLQTLRSSKPDGVVISQLILAAPDVDRDNFENIVSSINGIAKGITLYAANNDKALQASRTFHGGIPRAGDVPEDGPVVMPGVLDTIDVSAASTDSLGLNHSGYAENNTLLNDIGLIIQTGERPPEARVPILEKLTTTAGPYWRYPGGQ